MTPIRIIDEYNEKGHLLYVDAPYIGAYARGRTKEEALKKLPSEIAQYCRWSHAAPVNPRSRIAVIQEKQSSLQVEDADSDILFESERSPLTKKEYQKLRELACKSAQDFLTLYTSIPDKTGTVLTPRKTFYGDRPLTAQDMYEHTKNVNSYYFGELQIPAANEPDILTCRLRAFDMLEGQPDFLENAVTVGSYGEEWSLRKVFRRFLWHDRIHAKAMYRMAVRLCGASAIENPFCFVL